jgi:hypothetical protein
MNGYVTLGPANDVPPIVVGGKRKLGVTANDSEVVPSPTMTYEKLMTVVTKVVSTIVTSVLTPLLP